MKMGVAVVAAVVAAISGACSGPSEPEAVSLAGDWKGTITCYSMESPLSMTIEASAPEAAAMASGDGALTWNASVAFDATSSAVTITPKEVNVEAGTLTGALAADGNEMAGSMERQFCNSFTLTRQP